MVMVRMRDEEKKTDKVAGVTFKLRLKPSLSCAIWSTTVDSDRNGTRSSRKNGRERDGEGKRGRWGYRGRWENGRDKATQKRRDEEHGSLRLATESDSSIPQVFRVTH